MKSLLKRSLGCLMVAGLMLTAVGCSNETNNITVGENGEEIVTLNVWHQWTEGNDFGPEYEKAIAKFEEENPTIKINTEVLNTDAYKTKIQTEFSGSASAIDVFFYWGEGKAKQLVDAGKLLPLNDYLTEETLSKLKPGSLDAFTFGEEIYSLPTFGWYMTLFCNQELFDQAGAKIPTTYDELLDAVGKLSKLDGITPLASGAKDGWNAAFIYEALALREVGAENVNKMLSGEIAFDDAGYVEAANKVVELYQAGAFGKNPLEGSSTDADTLIFSGKAAMRLMGSWFANSIYNDKSSIVQDKMIATKIPMGDLENEADFAGGYIESFFANKNTKNPEAAAKFTIFINEAMAKAAHETGSGFSAWNIELDESNLNPLFIQISQLAAEGQSSVLAWDTVLDANTATTHVEEVQTLFAKDADVNAMIEAHKSAINK